MNMIWAQRIKSEGQERLHQWVRLHAHQYSTIIPNMTIFRNLIQEYADMKHEAFFGHVYRAFKILASLQLTVSSVRRYGCCTQTNQPTVQVSPAAVEMHGQKKRRRNTPSFKHYKRLGYKQAFGYKQILQLWSFQEGGWRNEKWRLSNFWRKLIGVCTAPCKEREKKNWKY